MIEQNVAGKEAVGNHTITVSQTCRNTTYVQTYTDTFNLRVNGVEDEIIIPEEDTRIVYNYRIYNHSNETTGSGVFDGCQPVPYIVQLTACGILQIGWDRPMNIPANFSEIQDTRVALRFPEYDEYAYNHYWGRYPVHALNKTYYESLMADSDSNEFKDGDLDILQKALDRLNETYGDIDNG